MLRSLLVTLLMATCAAALTPQQVVVVYNEESELSRSTAKHYASLRGIPDKQVVGLSGLGKGHDISRTVYDERVRRTLRMEAAIRDWAWPGERRLGRPCMHALVLMPDMPLRVGAPRPRPGDKALTERDKASAALDSELKLLGAAHYPLPGMVPNPVFGKDAPLDKLNLPILAVCRIDGPDEASIRRMVEDPVRVEKTGLQGWVVVDEGGPHPEGDAWLRSLAQRARIAGRPVFHETSQQRLAQAFPLMRSTAVYFGWYTHIVDGPFKAGTPGDFRFAPGAIAVHLFSFSASSVKSASSWAGALLKRGAAVTAGNVAEPFLGPTLHFDIFYDRLLKGYTVAEAALMASPVASWQSIVLGDPLYRPFHAVKDRPGPGVFGEWRRLYARAHGRAGELRMLLPSYARSPMRFELAEMAAWQCTEEGDLQNAYNLFAAACNGYRNLRDRTRAAILAATVLYARGEQERAMNLLRPWLDSPADSPYHAAVQASLKVMEGKKK